MRLFFETSSNMIPHTRSIAPMMHKPTHNIAVGNLGTNPVIKNSFTMGMASTIEIRIEIKDPNVKNDNGFFSLNNLVIMKMILRPSK